MLANIPNKTERQIQAYGVMFECENLLRVSMHNCLVKNVGTNYFSDSYFPKFEYSFDGRTLTIDTVKIVNEAKSLKNVESKYKQKFGYEYAYLWYMEFSHLLMILDHFWEKYFLDMFSNPKNIRKDLIQRAIRITSIRNSIAHNRYISDIEFNDLNSFYNILKASIKDELLINFESLVYNKLEKLQLEFVIVTEEISRNVKKGLVIPRDRLRFWKNLFGILQPEDIFINNVELFNEVYVLLTRYNKELPRKPGRSNEIETFVNENNLLSKINLLIK